MRQVLSFHTDFGEFARHVAIVGSEVDAQIATREAYIQEHFTSAKELLPVLQAVWDSGNLYEVSPSEGNLRHLSVMVYGSEKERATVVASGSLSSIIDISQACAFFCCAARMTSSEGINLSTFTFDLTAKSNQSHSVICLHPSWKRASGIKMGWHELFTKVLVIYGGPIFSYSQFRQSGMSTERSIYENYTPLLSMYNISVPVMTFLFTLSFVRMY